jgi:hypothetical protein
MSERETAMVVTYWHRVGGSLIEEFPLTKSQPNVGRRRADAVILPDKPKERCKPHSFVPLDDQDVIVVQAKIGRLGMPLLGQAFFSKLLCERLGAASVRSVALCEREDAALGPLFEQYGDCEVIVLPREEYAR